MKPYKNVSNRSTPQSEPILGQDQVPNNAGGYVYKLDDWKHAERFLILGSEGGTYYVGEHKLTLDNAKNLVTCLRKDGMRLVDLIVNISDSGRAPSNDPALFALAMCASMGDPLVRAYALEALPAVARIGTHWFHFLQYVQQFRGWGRGLRRAVANLYLDHAVDVLAYQVLKYQSRDGWSHRDALCLAHPKPQDPLKNVLFHYIMTGEYGGGIPLVEAYETVKKATRVEEVASLIRKFRLTREMIPTEWLNSKEVWEALLENMPMEAMLRNLNKMTAVGLLQGTGEHTKLVVARLNDEYALRNARLHPLKILVAMRIYEQGHGDKGSLRWEPVGRIVDALDAAFYKSFGFLEPTGKRIMLALDISGSMTWTHLAGMSITPREASAALALVTANVEEEYLVTGFTNSGWSSGYLFGGISALNISPRQRLDDVIRYIGSRAAGGTDCALPALYATAKNLKLDAFVIYTDNETWAGDIHPSQALEQYRQKTGIPAKQIVVGMTATEFTIADPDDAGSLDVVGFDTATPQLISDFIADKL